MSDAAATSAGGADAQRRSELPASERVIRWVSRSPSLDPMRTSALGLFRLTHWLRDRATLPVREELPFLLNTRRLVGCGVEVGVQEGYFSDIILTRWRGCHLISVDPWVEMSSDEYRDVLNVSQEHQDVRYRRTLE